MKTLNDTEFAKTLVALAGILDQRERDGLMQITGTEAPEMLLDAGTCINDTNIHSIYNTLLDTLQNLGQSTSGPIIESEESLVAIGQNLIQLKDSLPESGFTPMMQDQLSVLLADRIQHFEQMIGLLQRYLGRR